VNGLTGGMLGLHEMRSNQRTQLTRQTRTRAWRGNDPLVRLLEAVGEPSTPSGELPEMHMKPRPPASERPVVRLCNLRWSASATTHRRW
jgi:hypothetical protein